MTATSPEFDKEETKLVLSATINSVNGFDKLFCKHSSPLKIKGIVAYVFRFLRTSENCGNRLLGALSRQELHNALLHLAHYVHWFFFSDIISKIQAIESIV